VIFSFSGREEKKREEREREREVVFLFPPLSLLFSFSMESSYVLFAVVPHRALFFFLCSLLLIERVFVWQASVKYETDQSTLDFVSEQTMHPFNKTIYNPTHRNVSSMISNRSFERIKLHAK
jgi:hypothetical protein